MRFGKPTKNKRRHNPRYHTLTESARIENNSSKNLHDVQFYLEEFYPFCKKALGFEQDAAIVFESDYKNAKDPLGKTAYYDPSASSISVYVDARHPKDIMRSVAHELVHHHQNTRGDLQGTSMEEGYAQNDEHLREMEREAYEKGNLLFRDWEDHKKGGGDESLMARIMEKWGYDSAALNEEEKYNAGDKVQDPEGAVWTVIEVLAGKMIVEDERGNKKELKKEDATPAEETEPTEEPTEEPLEEYGGDDFDMESLEREFPWLKKVKPDIEMGTVPLEVLADIAADEDIGELEPEEEPLEEAGGDFVALAAEYAGDLDLAGDEDFKRHMEHFEELGRTPKDAADRWETLNTEEEPYDWEPDKDPDWTGSREVTMKEAGIGNLEPGDHVDIHGGVASGGSGKIKTIEGDEVKVKLTKAPLGDMADEYELVVGKEITVKHEWLDLSDLPGDKRVKPDDENQGVYAGYYTEATDPNKEHTQQGDNEMNLEETIRQAVRKAIKERNLNRAPVREAGGSGHGGALRHQDLSPKCQGLNKLSGELRRDIQYAQENFQDSSSDEAELEDVLKRLATECDLGEVEPEKPTTKMGADFSLEETVRQAVRKALKEKQYRRETGPETEDDKDDTNEGKESGKTKENDDNPALKGDQKDELTDDHQKAIIAAAEDDKEKEKNEGKLPPWLEKKEGKEDDDKEVVEEDDDDEKNESLDNKDWWDNSLYERLVRKWTK